MPDQEDIEWLLKGKDAWNNRRAQNPFLRPDLSRRNISDLLEQRQRITESGKPDLRSYDLKNVKFSGSHIIGVDMSGADASFADFTDAWLNDSDLTEAMCDAADFTRARLHRSKLIGAQLADTKFINAQLIGADLAGAFCLGTDFTGADLTDIDPSDVDLIDGELRGADCTHAMLWKLNYITFDRQAWSYSRADLGEEIKIESVEDLLRYMEKLNSSYASRDGSEPTRLYYRGEAERFPNLTPSVMRANESGEKPLRSNESEMLVDLMTRRPDDFAGEQTALGQLMTAQHFGLPTRLLDITQNPLVALFHATSKKQSVDSDDGHLHALAVRKSIVKTYSSPSISVVANFTRLPRSDQNLLLTKTAEYTDEQGDHRPTDYLTAPRRSHYLLEMSRLFQYIRTERPSFEDRINPYDFFRVFVVEPQQTNERIRAQSGAFLLSAFHERFDEIEVTRVYRRTPFYHQYSFVIPHERKDRIRSQLRSLNVTEETMFPGLEKAAEVVKGQYGGTV